MGYNPFNHSEPKNLSEWTVHPTLVKVPCPDKQHRNIFILWGHLLFLPTFLIFAAIFLNYVLSLKEDEGHLEHQEKSSRKALCGVIKSLKVKNDVFYGKKHILVQFFGNKWLSNTCIYTAHTCIGRAVHVCPRACPNSPSFKANVISSMLPSLLIHLDCLSFSSLCPQNPKSFPVLCFCLQHWSILQLALYLIRK